MLLPCSAAVSSAIFQNSFRVFFTASDAKTLSERTDVPCLPAVISPEGVAAAATAIGKYGWVYGLKWSRASLNVNQSALYEMESHWRALWGGISVFLRCILP